MTKQALMNAVSDSMLRLGMHNWFIHLNYRSLRQDLAASCSAESMELLRKVAREVDPQIVFERKSAASSYIK